MSGLYIIITDFNGYSQTRRCLEALRASRCRCFTALVVDHGTTNETRVRLAAEFPEAIRITGSSDLWWTGATNRGIRYALDQKADRIMLVNNDCYVTPEAIGILLRQSLEHPEAIIAPVQRDWHSGKVSCLSPRTGFLIGFSTLTGTRKLTSDVMAKILLPVKIIIGGRGVIIPSLVFSAVGFFDEEQLIHYGSDHDFYLRARSRNVPLYIATNAFVHIDNSSTTLANNLGALNLSEFLRTLYSIRSHRNLRDVATLFRKHYPIPHLYMVGVALYTMRYFLVYLMKRGMFLIQGCFKS